ncbi:MAG: chitobiase/beta-hexosaminidase C-terminal domain-containing protein, partial [Lacipirellulaceae bacterium]
MIALIASPPHHARCRESCRLHAYDFSTGAFDTGISQFLADEKANNWFGIRNRVTNDHGFQFFIHDNEHSLGANFSNNIDRTEPFTSSNDRLFSQFNPGFLHQDLLASPEYRLAFADRVRLHMFDGGVMTPAASQALILARAAQVEPGIIAESARWGDSVRNTPRNKTHWQNEINSITGSYFGSRNSLVLGQLQGGLLYPTISAPSYNQYGGTISSGFALQISAAQGAIYYTLDGSDPRAIGGGINLSSAQVYNSPITPGNGQTIQARALFNGQWSALTTATFVQDLPGDFGVNGNVDQADLNLWKGDYGTSSGAVADADQDGDADGLDFLTWQKNSQQAALQFQAATSPPVQQAQVHTTERTRLELIDAAIE